MTGLRLLSTFSFLAVLACDDTRQQPPFVPSPNTGDAGVSGDAATTLDSGMMGSPDSGVPPAPEVDPRCVDGMYTETMPDPSVSIASELASYSMANTTSFIQAVLDKRYPTGAYLVRGGLTNMQPGHCIDLFLRDRSTGVAIARQLSTVVHECGHFFDIGSGGRYHITSATSFSCANGDTVARRGRTFARSLLNNDAYSARRPPCGGRREPSCDSYADVYLDGDPNDGTFQGGDQGFNSVLEETVQYVNSLATGLAFADQLQRGASISERDGILTFLWYIGRYLRMARLEHTDAYALLSGDACWRDAILTTWGRAWLMLAATESSPNLGINDEAIIALVRDPDILDEIARLRVAEGCP